MWYHQILSGKFGPVRTCTYVISASTVSPSGVCSFGEPEAIVHLQLICRSPQNGLECADEQHKRVFSGERASTSSL